MIALTALMVAAPVERYEDPKGRFAFDVAPEFALSPRFGETRGIRFRHSEGADFEVLVLKQPCSDEGAPVPTSRGTEQKWGWGKGCLLVRIEAAPSLRRRLRGALQAMTESLLSSKSTPKKEPQQQSPAPPAQQQGSLVGTWQSEQGPPLRFERRRFEWGPVSGRWRSVSEQPPTVEMRAGEQVFRLRWRLQDDQLILFGPRLKRPRRFQRVKASGREAPASTSLRPKNLHGRWRSKNLELQLHSDGRFVLGPWKGQWSLEPPHLRLQASPVDFIEYRIELAGTSLSLEGADLDQPIVLRRVGDVNVR